jgi:hypothetical protein
MAKHGYTSLTISGVHKGESMSKRILATIAVALAAATAAFALNTDELNKITFQNTTGTKIQMIFLSPGDSEYWGPDLIGADYILKDGGSIAYYVHYPEATFKFDVMAVDDKGNKFELRDLQVTDGAEQTVKLTKKSLNDTAPDFTLATLHVENVTGVEIQYLFISPSDSDAWGADLLDSETTLADGDVHSIVIPFGKNKVTYNLMGVDGNGDEYSFDVTLDPKKGKEFDVSIEEGDLQTSE